jgi:hypothetical protein
VSFQMTKSQSSWNLSHIGLARPFFLCHDTFCRWFCLPLPVSIDVPSNDNALLIVLPCLKQFLFSSNSFLILLTEGSRRKPLANLYLGVNCQYSWCFMFFQSLMTHLVTLPDIRHLLIMSH